MTTHTNPTAGRGLETKFVALDALARADGSGAVFGHASYFGEVDQSGDRVMPGAFAASLARLAAANRRVKFLWQHDPARPIGVWHEMREDPTGLWVEGEILAEIAQGAEALALMRAGAIDGLSIGYRTIRAEPDKTTGGRKLCEIDLWEVSLVTFPMLPSARASLSGAEGTDEMAAALAELLGEPGPAAE